MIGGPDSDGRAKSEVSPDLAPDVETLTPETVPETEESRQKREAERLKDKIYARRYYTQHRGEITANRRKHYRNHPELKEKIQQQALEKYRRLQEERRRIMAEQGIEQGKEIPVRGYNRPRLVQVEGAHILVHSVKEFADRVGRNVQTITAWEEDKIIPSPTVVDARGRRWYSEEHMNKISGLSKEFRVGGKRSLDEFKAFLKERLRG